MLLAIDIGNTNIGIAFMEGETVFRSFRLMTTNQRTSDEFAVMLTTFITQAGVSPASFDSAVVASVVPNLTARVTTSIRLVTQLEAHEVSPAHADLYGISLNVSEPMSVGADILVDCIGARASFEGSTLVVDCGTATKYIYIDSKGAFSTLAIGLGIEAGTRALTSRTAQLPQIELEDPKTVLGTDTLSAMQAGLYYGFLGSIEYTLRRFLDELGTAPHVVATGGLGGIFAPELALVEAYDPNLIYKGLAIINERLKTL